MLTTSELLDRLVKEGGCVVTEAQCTPTEVTEALARDDYALNYDGKGFVRRTQSWLDRQHYLRNIPK